MLHVQEEASVCVGADLHIETAEGSIENNGTLIAEGNITKEPSATYVATNTQGSRRLILQGTSPIQRITGDFTGSQSFHELSLNKEEGMVELNGNVEVSQTFNLIQGKLRTDMDSGTQASDYRYELYLSNPDPNALTGNVSVFDSGNFVEGRLRRSVIGTGSYSFPVGITENNPFSVTFQDAAPLSAITATYENGTSTPMETNLSCSSTSATSTDCVIGRWNVQATAENYNYDILFTPSSSLLQNCSAATAYFVAKNGNIDCNLDRNISDGISSSQTGNFGVFDLPSVDDEIPNAPVACATPDNPEVTMLSRTRLIIEWSPVSEASRYVIQVRLKGRTNWAITATLRNPFVKIWATTNNDFEYRIKTICSDDSVSAYSPIYEFSTNGNFNTAIADSRTVFIADINLNELTVSDKNWKISPNPATDEIQLFYEVLTDEAQVSIISASGKKIKENTLSIDNAIHLIDVSNLLPGFYFMMVNDGGRNIISEKIIKQSRY